MPATDQDARALTHLAVRLRAETHGCARWDAEGTYVVIKAELVGKSLPYAVEAVLCHATDPEARTPGAIKRRFTPPRPSTEPQRMHPPRRGQDCPHHPGQWATSCGGCAADRAAADGPETPPRAWEPGDAAAGAAAVRAQIKPMRTFERTEDQ